MRGRRRRIGALGRFGAGLALDRDQLFEIVDVLFQLLDAGLGVRQFLFLGHHVFGAVVAPLPVAAWPAGFRQAQLVLRFVGGGRAFLDLGRDAAGRALPCLRLACRFALAPTWPASLLR
jgi:hypothetical protein